LEAVGRNEYGQCDVSAWCDIVAVAAGNAHTLGLSSDGKVFAAGDNKYGQCDTSEWRGIQPPYNYSRIKT
jgi:alpha-tubulin suppressor-like RCC1 family protein